MSSAKRKMVRDMRRKMAMKGITDEKLENITKAVESQQDAKYKAVEQTTRKALQDWEKNDKPKIQAATRGDVLVRLVSYLHDSYGFGQKRLEKFFIGFLVYMNDIRLEKIKNADIMDAIKEETGFDTRKALGKAKDYMYADSVKFEKIEKKIKKERAC